MEAQKYHGDDSQGKLVYRSDSAIIQFNIPETKRKFRYKRGGEFFFPAKAIWIFITSPTSHTQGLI